MPKKKSICKFKIGQIIQNKTSMALYKVIGDSLPVEPCTQIHLSHVIEREAEFEAYKPSSRNKSLRKYYANSRSSPRR